MGQVRGLIERGALRLVRGSCGLDAVKPGAAWPADIISPEFACIDCGRRFELEVDAYHGGGSMRPAPDAP